MRIQEAAAVNNLAAFGEELTDAELAGVSGGKKSVETETVTVTVTVTTTTTKKSH